MVKLNLLHNDQKHSRKIIVLEDDEADFLITEVNLKNAEFENELIWIDDVDDFFPYLEQNVTPLLVLLDLNMPKKNGKEILQELHQNKKFKDIKVILLTNAEKDYLEEIGLKNVPYIQKPLTLGGLQKAISSFDQSLQIK